MSVLGLFPTGLLGVSFEGMTRGFLPAKGTLPSPPRVPVEGLVLVAGGPDDPPPPEKPPGLLKFGGSGVPSPIEDMNADGYMTDLTKDGALFGGIVPNVSLDQSKKKPKKKRPQDDTPGVISLDEMDRQVITFKVYNPDDKDMWVKVQAVKSIRLRLSMSGGSKQVSQDGSSIFDINSALSGRIVKLNLRPPPPPAAPSGS